MRDRMLKILHPLDFTPQKPLRRALQQDRDALERWRAVEWPRIKKRRLAGAKPWFCSSIRPGFGLSIDPQISNATRAPNGSPVLRRKPLLSG